ncbi:phosphopantetheine-binding protein [Calditrichota bacterium]
MDQLKTHLIQIFNILFPSVAERENVDYDLLAFEDVIEWDSLGQLNLLTALEEEFSITIPDETALKLTSFPAVEDYIASVLIEEGVDES